MRNLMRQREREPRTGNEGGSRSLVYALAALLACFLVCSVFLMNLEQVRQPRARDKARYIVESYATKIQYVITDAYSSV